MKKAAKPPDKLQVPSVTEEDEEQEEEEEPEVQDEEALMKQKATSLSEKRQQRRSKKAPVLPAAEKRNWLIHLHYVRKEFATAKALIDEQLAETAGNCEYAVYVQAMILRMEGEVQKSLTLFQTCHELNKRNPDNMKQIGKNLALLGRHKQAIDCYHAAVELGAKDWEISHSLGVCFMFINDYEQAEQHFTEALVEHKRAVTYQLLAQLHMKRGDVDKAMEVLTKGVEHFAEDMELLTSLGLLHLRGNDFHKAFELLGRSLAFDPENYKAILAAGSLMQEHGDFDVALSKYRAAAQNIPESAALWNNIAMCFFGKKKYVAAISCLKRAHYFAPFDWKILHNLSLLHLTMEQYASAFQFANTALTLKQDHGPLFMLLALALSHLQQDGNAEQAYRQAHALSSSEPQILLNMAIFHHTRNRTGEAAKYLAQLRKLKLEGEDNRELLEMSKKLEIALNVGGKTNDNDRKTKKKVKLVEPKPTASEESFDSTTMKVTGGPSPSSRPPSQPISTSPRPDHAPPPPAGNRSPRVPPPVDSGRKARSPKPLDGSEARVDEDNRKSKKKKKKSWRNPDVWQE